MAEVVESENVKVVSGINVKTDYYLKTFIFKWSLENFYRLVNDFEPSKEFEAFSGVKCNVRISKYQHMHEFSISFTKQLQYTISLFEDNGKQILQENYDPQFGRDNQSSHYFDLTNVKLPNDRLIVVCEFNLREKIESEQKFTCWSKKFSPQNEYLKTLVQELEEQDEHELENKVEFHYYREILSVNRKILSLRSPVFARLLTEKDLEGSEPKFDISAKSVPAMRAMISFIYTGLIPDCDFETLCRLYHVALFYKVQGLEEACGHSLVSQLTPENVCDALRIATCEGKSPLEDVWHLFPVTTFPEGDPLVCHALAFVRLHLETILKTNGWRELVTAQPQLALKILK